MSYLVDSSVWLEMLLGQEHAEGARQVILRVPASELAIAEFALYSIGLVLTRLGKGDLFQEFIRDILLAARIRRIVLTVEDMVRIPETMRRFRLDFDDAYQYMAAKRHNLTLVSLDADFDHTERGRKTPAQVLAELSKGQE